MARQSSLVRARYFVTAGRQDGRRTLLVRKCVVDADNQLPSRPSTPLDASRLAGFKSVRQIDWAVRIEPINTGLFGIGSATESSETGGKLYESKKSSTESNSSPSLSDSNRLSRVMPRFASALVIVDLFDWERPATAWSTVVKSSIR